jgi:flagellar biosynthetic protein FlhB
MAEEEQNRSEAPTPFKLQRARQKGQVARGQDLSYFASLATFLLCLSVTGAGLLNALELSMRDAFVSSAMLAGDRDTIFAVVRLLVQRTATPLEILIATIFAVVLLFECLQTGLVFSAAPLKPDFSKLNPAQGLKRLFSLRLLLETGKNIAKLLAFSGAAWLLVRHILQHDISAVQDASSLGTIMARTAFRLLAIFVGLALFFAIIDQLITRRTFLKRMRMSRRELKQEARDREGEPRLKQKRKQLHAEFTRASRSLKGLRGADMLVVNPIHVAIALRYDAGRMAAPTVVAAGTNQLAMRLKRLALLYGIAIIEEPTLARSLLRTTAIGQTIPPSSYQAVARLYNRKRRPRG